MLESANQEDFSFVAKYQSYMHSLYKRLLLLAYADLVSVSALQYNSSVVISLWVWVGLSMVHYARGCPMFLVLYMS